MTKWSWYQPWRSGGRCSCRTASWRRAPQDSSSSPQSRWSQQPLTAQWTPGWTWNTTPAGKKPPSNIFYRGQKSRSSNTIHTVAVTLPDVRSLWSGQQITWLIQGNTALKTKSHRTVLSLNSMLIDQVKTQIWQYKVYLKKNKNIYAWYMKPKVFNNSQNSPGLRRGNRSLDVLNICMLLFVDSRLSEEARGPLLSNQQ